MKKPIYCLLVTIALHFCSYAQQEKVSYADLKILRKKEDSLKTLAKNLLTDSIDAGRIRSDSLFVRTSSQKPPGKKLLHVSLRFCSGNF